jgi:hypothetical protein
MAGVQRSLNPLEVAMRKPTALVAIAVVLFVLAWCAFPEFRPHAAGQVRVEIPNAAKAVQKWEYETFSALKDQPTETELSQFGKEGWELCQVIPREPHSLLIFKRPLK